MPQIKHANSLAIAVFVTLAFFEWNVIRTYFFLSLIAALSAYEMTSGDAPLCLAFKALDFFPAIPRE